MNIGLVRVEDNKRVAGKTEEEIYKTLGLKFIPPELREDCGEIQAAAEDKLPDLITQADIQGDVHMHTVETDGKCTIEEMALAARDRGYKYMAITDHSKNLAFANGLDDKRAKRTSRRYARRQSTSRASRFLPALKWTYWRMANLIFLTQSWSRWIS